MQERAESSPCDASYRGRAAQQTRSGSGARVVGQDVEVLRVRFREAPERTDREDVAQLRGRIGAPGRLAGCSICFRVAIRMSEQFCIGMARWRDHRALRWVMSATGGQHDHGTTGEPGQQQPDEEVVGEVVDGEGRLEPVVRAPVGTCRRRQGAGARPALRNHFPTKDALIEAVVMGRLTTLAVEAEQLRNATDPDSPSSPLLAAGSTFQRPNIGSPLHWLTRGPTSARFAARTQRSAGECTKPWQHCSLMPSAQAASVRT